MVYCRVNTLTHRSLHLIQLNALYFLSSIQTEDAFKDSNSKNGTSQIHEIDGFTFRKSFKISLDTSVHVSAG